jgi:23S rRNA (guanosine2251-2'-O)-methyltransferase
MKNEQMIFGIRPVLEALDAGKELDKILLQKGLRGDLFHELIDKVRQYDVPLQTVPIDRLNRITRKNHQGVIAFQSRISYHNIEQILPGIFERGGVPLILVLDHVTDVRNFGAITRTAECSGVDAIIIPSKGSAAINEDAMKTSAGALNIIPVCRTDSLEDTLKYLKNSGLKVVAASEKGNVDHFDEKFDLPLAIVMGAEDTGVSARLLRISDSLVSIPQKGKIGSLNVSVAAGVLLFEVLRQRKA